MNTCLTCTHWSRLIDRFDVQYHGPYAGKCASDKFSDERPRVGRDEFHLWSHDGMAAGFVTGEDFGCIHHERKS